VLPLSRSRWRKGRSSVASVEGAIDYNCSNGDEWIDGVSSIDCELTNDAIGPVAHSSHTKGCVDATKRRRSLEAFAHRLLVGTLVTVTDAFWRKGLRA
jgi:hypothetical protein